MHDSTTIGAALAQLGIPFSAYSHAEHHTADQAERDLAGWPAGAHVKNLLVKDKAGALTLITTLHHRRIDLVKLGKHRQTKDRWSFASEEAMYNLLGVRPGSVSPLGLANAKPGGLAFIVDEPALAQPLIYVHPLVNTQTYALAPADLLRAIASWGHSPVRLDLGDFEKS